MPRSPERDNGYDHRAGTIDLNIEKHTQVRLRVHRFVIRRIDRLIHYGNSWVSPMNSMSESAVNTCDHIVQVSRCRGGLILVEFCGVFNLVVYY